MQGTEPTKPRRQLRWRTFFFALLLIVVAALSVTVALLSPVALPSQHFSMRTTTYDAQAVAWFNCTYTYTPPAGRQVALSGYDAAANGSNPFQVLVEQGLYYRNVTYAFYDSMFSTAPFSNTLYFEADGYAYTVCAYTLNTTSVALTAQVTAPLVDTL